LILQPAHCLSGLALVGAQLRAWKVKHRSIATYGQP
jgi:hypothetical protein